MQDQNEMRRSPDLPVCDDLRVASGSPPRRRLLGLLSATAPPRAPLCASAAALSPYHPRAQEHESAVKAIYSGSEYMATTSDDEDMGVVSEGFALLSKEATAKDVRSVTAVTAGYASQAMDLASSIDCDINEASKTEGAILEKKIASIKSKLDGAAISAATKSDLRERVSKLEMVAMRAESEAAFKAAVLKLEMERRRIDWPSVVETAFCKICVDKIENNLMFSGRWPKEDPVIDDIRIELFLRTKKAYTNVQLHHKWRNMRRLYNEIKRPTKKKGKNEGKGDQKLCLQDLQLQARMFDEISPCDKMRSIDCSNVGNDGDNEKLCKEREQLMIHKDDSAFDVKLEEEAKHLKKQPADACEEKEEAMRLYQKEKDKAAHLQAELEKEKNKTAYLQAELEKEKNKTASLQAELDKAETLRSQMLQMLSSGRRSTAN